ncbi:reverse transcriptase-like protein [Sphingomonas abietis]|uniref:Reverse transcriptase-like protein n=1 Tax=Sphingomonas abietis TaxID=3012344 RepID=A0ABY7NPU2_9SPHN|nr:reverse transcriptase-like protein [Sphingomonas abietis]WBO23403.1 reverse transcriptase-like protein [Sphingomonas abietis]
MTVGVTPRRLKIFFDGGCRPNPGRIEVAVFARGIAYFGDDCGEGSNGDAEWLALIAALQIAHALSDGPFDLIGDARFVIDRANGTYPCRTPEVQAHRDHFLKLAAPRPPARIRWIGRAQNLAGIALEQRRGGVLTSPAAPLP